MSPRFTIRPLSAQPDARLLELVRAGDGRAFETLVRRHRRALTRYCRRIGLSEHRAEDVLQQALTKAWLALDRGVEVREPRAWLYRVVHNTAVNSERGAALRRHESIDAVPSARTPRAPGEIDSGLHARDALGHVASLPELQRDAIVLTAIAGHSHEEAASMLGVSDGAVRGLLYRARTTLRSAAAALSPQGLLGLLARASAGGGQAVRSAEVSAGGAAAGAAGVLTKGVLATAVAGLLAAGGTLAHLQSAAPGRRAHAAPQATASSHETSSRAPSGGLDAQAQAQAQAFLLAVVRHTARSDGGSGRNGGDGGRERSRRDDSATHEHSRSPFGGGGDLSGEHGGGSGATEVSDGHDGGTSVTSAGAQEHRDGSSAQRQGPDDSAAAPVLMAAEKSAGSGGPGPSGENGAQSAGSEASLRDGGASNSSGDRSPSPGSDGGGGGSLATGSGEG